jgi:ATP-dependent RNA helicase DDX5/DBP2
VKDLDEDQVKEIKSRLNLSVTQDEGQPSCPPPIESFEDMNLTREIMIDIRHHEYLKPTPIQAQAIPTALSGKDILGCAETGSGKTASFSIPMIAHCTHQPPIKRGDGPLGVVLAPTRELAQQIADECKIFSNQSKIKTCIIVGGAPIQEQRSILRSGVHIVVATPGRFLDHLQQRNTSLHRVSFVVLDEADRMLDMGFEPQIREILMNLPEKHQTLLFSATMPEEIEGLANEYLNKPYRIKVGAVSRPTSNVVQHLQKTTEQDKLEALLNLVSQEQEMAERVGGPGAPLPMTVVFVETKAKCEEVKDTLNVNQFSAVALHGGRDQREREAALLQFRKGIAKILVATDIASRGLDVSGIAHVINMDLPRQFEDYVHRIGRTGRAGNTGRATSMYTDRDSYVVAQIKHAISQLEKGNDLVFATGKAARAREREAQQAFKYGGKEPEPEEGAVTLKLDDKFKFMSMSAAGGEEDEGCADDAWDD